MTRPVRTIPPETTACEVANLFAAHGIGSAVVVAPDASTPVGIVTESDLIQQVAAEAALASLHVDSFMSTPLTTTTSSEDIHAAATVMKDLSIRRLPVVDEGALVGILTTTDLSYYLPRLRSTVLRGRNELAGH